MGTKEIIASIEQFETTFDTYHQAIQKNIEDNIQNVSIAWKKMKMEQEENEKLLAKIREQNSEITELRTKAEGLDKKIEELKSIKDDLTSKVTEFNTNLEKITSDLKKPQFELETLSSKLNDINEKINNKEKEKTTLDQKKIDNESRESNLEAMHSKRMEEVNAKIEELTQNSFFTNFIINNSDEEIHEVGILSAIFLKGSCKLDDLKKDLDVPPIMATRTIKQLAVKGIINLDEDTNTISLP
ncbi:MAG: HBL/NHE enterotoxin family protein [Promethearchaeota archaeon]